MLVSLSSLKPGATYQVQFAGVTSDGTMTEWTNSYSLAVPQDSPPPAPTNGAVTFTNGAGNFRVSWNAPVSLPPDFLGYAVEVSDDDFAGDVVDARHFVGQDTAFDFTLSMNDALYATPMPTLYFRIYTIDNGIKSSVIPLSTSGTYGAVETPSNPAGSSIPGGIKWSWTPPSGPTANADIISHYEIDVDTGTAAFFDASDFDSVYGLQYLTVDTPGATRYAKIRTVDVFGRKVNSVSYGTGTVGSTGGADDATAPTWNGGSYVTVTPLATGKDGRSAATAAWPAAVELDSTIAGYFIRIKKHLAVDSTWETSFMEGAGLDHTFTNLDAGAQYNVEVAAQNGYGLTSSWIAINTPTYFTTAAAAAAAPLNGTLSATGWLTSDPNLTVVWTDTTAAADPIFKEYRLTIVGSSTKTFSFGASQKSFVITPEIWTKTFGTTTPSITSMTLAAIDDYDRVTSGSISNATGWSLAGPSVGTPTFTYGDYSVTALWSLSAGYASTYNVYAAAGAAPSTSGTTNLVASSNGLSATFAIPVTNTSTWQVIVVATDPFGRTANSGTGTTATVSAIGAITATSYGGYIEGSWTAIGSATKYKIETGVNASPATLVGTTDQTRFSFQPPTSGPLATVSTRASTTTAKTLVTATAHGLGVGVYVSVVGLGANYDGTFLTTAGTTGTTINYTAVASNSESTTTVSTGWVSPGYVMKVTPMNSIGTVGTSATSSPVASIKYDTAAPASVTNPTSGSGLTAVAAPNLTTTITGTISYTKPPDFDQYVIRWATGASDPANWNTLEQSSDSFTITGVPRGVTFRVSILARDVSGNKSAPSTSGTVATPSATIPAPTAVSRVWSTDNLVLTWSHAAGSQPFERVAYDVELSLDNSTWKKWPVSGNATQLALTPKDILEAFGSYVGTFSYLRISAIADSGGASGYATWAAISNSYAGVGGVVTVTGGVKAASASWSAVAGADKYQLFVDTVANAITAADTKVYEGKDLAATWQSNSGTFYIKVLPVNIYGNAGSFVAGDGAGYTVVATGTSDIDAPTTGGLGTYGTAVFSPVDETWTLPISWPAATDAGGGTPITYRIKYSISGGRTVAVRQMDIVGELASAITGLISGDVVTATYTAADKYGNETVSPVGFTGTTSTILPDSSGPAAPTGVTVTWQTDGALISWSNPTIPADYARTEVRFNTSNTDPLATNTKAIRYLNRTATSVLITNSELKAAYPSITNTSTVYAWVALYDTSNNTNVSTVGSATRSALAGPTVTTQFTASSDTVSAAWSAVSGASFYRVYYGPSNPPTEFTEETQNNTWKITYVTDTSYYYRVAAVDPISGTESFSTTYGPRTTTVSGSAKIIDLGSVGLHAGSIADDTYGNKLVRIWAGSTSTAPKSGRFKVYDDGAIQAALGRVGGWELLGSDIISTGSSVQSVFLPGTRTEYVQTTASQTALVSTYVLDVAVRVALSNYITGGGTSEYRSIIGSYTGTNSLATTQWMLAVDGAGTLAFNTVNNSATAYKATTSLSSSIVADGQPVWLRMVVNAGTSAYAGQSSYSDTGTVGAADSATFYYGVSSLTDTQAYSGNQTPLAWKSLGSTPMAVSLATITSPVTIGTTTDATGLTSKFPIVGKVSNAIIWQGAYNATTKTVSFMAGDISKTTNSAPNGGTLGGTWSITGSQSGFSASAVDPLNTNSRFEKDASAWYVNGGVVAATRGTQSLFGTGSLTVPATTGAIYSDPSYVGGGKRYTASAYAYGAATGVKLRVLPIQTLRPISRSSGGTTTKTLTFSAPHGLIIGDKIVAKNLGGSGYDSASYTAPVSITGVTATSISYLGTGTVNDPYTYISNDTPVIEVIHDYSAAQEVTVVGGASAWSAQAYSVSVVPRASVDSIRLLVTNTNGTACYVDGVRLETGSSTASYGFAYSATDSIRLESTGAVNVVNDYGRIGLTNRKESDAAVSIAGNSASSLLAPTMRFINTGKDGKASQDIPAEISTTLNINSYGVVGTTGNSLLLHSGAVFGLIGSTDESLIARKRRAALISMKSNMNEAAGSLTTDPDPETGMTISADHIDISGNEINLLGQVVANSLISDKVVQGEIALGPLSGRGDYSSYADFALDHVNSIDFKGSDFVIIDGNLWTKNDSKENLFTNGNLVADPVWAAQTSYFESGIGDSYGVVTKNTAGALVTGLHSTSLATEIFVQAAVKPNGGVDRTTGQVIVQVQFYQADGTTSTGTANISNSATLTTDQWSNIRGYVSVPGSTTQFRLSITDSGNNISVGKFFVKKSTRVDFASGLSIDSGSNLLTGTLFDQFQVGCEIVINGAGAAAANLTTVITGWVSPTQVYIETSASTTVSNVGGLIRDEYYLTPALNSWSDSGDIRGPAGPPTEWSVVANTLESGSAATAEVTGASPDNTLTLGIPKGDASFAQVAAVAPVARSEGDLWFDPSLTTTVSSLDISNADSYNGTLFNTGLRVYDQGSLKAQIDSAGRTSFQRYAFEGRAQSTTTATTPGYMYRIDDYILTGQTGISSYMNPSNGIFTVPVNGLYRVSGFASANNASLDSTQYFILLAYRADIGASIASSSTNYSTVATCMFEAIAPAADTSKDRRVAEYSGLIRLTAGQLYFHAIQSSLANAATEYATDHRRARMSIVLEVME
jgi:hypothetical protein